MLYEIYIIIIEPTVSSVKFLFGQNTTWMLVVKNCGVKKSTYFELGAADNEGTWQLRWNTFGQLSQHSRSPPLWQTAHQSSLGSSPLHSDDFMSMSFPFDLAMSLPVGGLQSELSFSVSSLFVSAFEMLVRSGNEMASASSESKSSVTWFREVLLITDSRSGSAELVCGCLSIEGVTVVVGSARGVGVRLPLECDPYVLKYVHSDTHIY